MPPVYRYEGHPMKIEPISAVTDLATTQAVATAAATATSGATAATSSGRIADPSAAKPATTASAGGSAAAAAPPAGGARPAGGAKPAAAPVSTPAATVTLTEVPASVSAADRALYLQILRSVGGNATVALSVLQARTAAAAQG
jgi:hypothetical protein